MEKEYYMVALNNNKSRNPMKLDNIIYTSDKLDVPECLTDTLKENKYESVEILATKSIYSLKDVLTGEIMIASSTGYTDGLSYFKLVKATNKDIVRITNKYKSMSKDDLIRYKNSINEIKELSIKLYKEDNLKRIKEQEEEKNAIEYLKYMEEFGI